MNTTQTQDQTNGATPRATGQSSAIFVGSGSLLIHCAQAYRDAGHRVAAVLSGHPKILEWARSEGMAALHFEDPSKIDVSDIGFDYLFSVANLQVLPAALISQARQLAINFHDALLPDYAGLNATAWALLAREPVHGITWHQMTPAVDAGAIVCQRSFAVAPEETALTLNAKCYEAALAGFSALLQDIDQGTLKLTPQTRPARHFRGSARPPLLATLDFSQSAKDLSALVRALDFGPQPYPNPLARPKIFTGDRILLLRSARVSDVRAWAPAGTVLDVQGETLQIATGNGMLAVEGCTDVAGLPHGLRPGDVLPPLSAPLQARLTERLPQAGRGEPHWLHALTHLAPVELPYPQRLAPNARALSPEALSPAPGACHAMALQVPSQGPRSVAGFMAWLTALTGQARVSVFYADAELDAQALGVEAWLSPWVPLTLSLDVTHTIGDAVTRTEALIRKAQSAGPMPTDLPSRLAEPPAGLAQTRQVGVCLKSLSRWQSDPATPALCLTTDDAGRELVLLADTAVFTAQTAGVMAAHLGAYLGHFEASSDVEKVAEIPLMPPHEAERVVAENATTQPFDTGHAVHEVIAAQAMRNADQVAIVWHGLTLRFGDLEARASALAARLGSRGVQPGDVVGLCLERTPELVVGLLAIWKAGAAYLPLDPAYPAHRLSFMIEDSATRLVLTTQALAQTLTLSPERSFLLDKPVGPSTTDAPLPPPVWAGEASKRVAYVIYTSGSTGKPKGVMVTHRNVMNFFAGMDARVPFQAGARWLAVTSLSFDISVLELCWTLSRGLSVALHSSVTPTPQGGPEFSLFYFGNDRPDRPQEAYKLLFEGARFADREGFAAVWTPERHFHTFGGLYPNAAMTSAALAAITQRVQIRAGSCVLPLHHPVRAAEDWAVVDNISQGRVGISFAAGWQPNDFVLAPEAFAGRKAEMFERMALVQRLWRGERVAFDNPLGERVQIQTRPSPVQAEIPLWVTAAGNPETFEQAGQRGYRLLTHLLGQSLVEVADKIAIYRAAWRQAGHPGQGHVTLMLHTFVGDDEDLVREMVREPMKGYLRSSVDLIRQAAWSFPTFVQRSAGKGKTPLEIMESEALSEQDMDALLEHAFARYYNSSGLFGSQQRCLAMVDKLRDVGVDEIGCLVDFGIDADTVLAHLNDLKRLMDVVQGGLSSRSGQRISVADDIVRHGATHLQCTPSMASMLVADAPGRAALSKLSALLVGGEALPIELARQLCALVPGPVLNMYGPTETTVWSTCCDLQQVALDAPGAFVPLGRAIANTQLAVRNKAGLACPALVPGELLIGGEGVTLGYWGRPELTAERFVSQPFMHQPPNPAGADTASFYRTGDLVRRHPNGMLEFLGRTDHQVKIRGHRIELGEIESLLLRQVGVKQAVVVARDDPAGGARLVGYVTAMSGVTLQPDRLRQALAAELPEIMLPASLLVLPALPLTPNGKIDRLALPDPRAAALQPQVAAPESDFEKTIAALWRDVLGRSEVGMSDNFFDLGGHSLLVVQVQRRLREVSGREVSITDMFRFPTIRGLAQHLAGRVSSTAVGDGLSRARMRRNLRPQPASQTSPVA